MLRRAEVASIARLELGEVLRSRWILFAGALYAALAGVFVLVGVRESTVVGFTGMGRVLLAFSNALVLVLPLLGLVATGQAVNRARDDGTLELLFSHPVSRGGYFVAVSLVRYLALALPLLVLLPALGLAGELWFRQSVPWGYLARVAAVSASLLLASVAAGLCVSTFVRSPAKALMALLLVFALATTLVDFALVGMMLQWRLRPEAVFALAAANPVEAARMALLASAEPELSTLGPVGFYLAHRVGPDALVALGIVWPAAVGLAAWAAALRRFRRGDLV
jgi:ABC-type transport system involved in multi-copper enzyme maturation permease subunit